MIEIVGWPSFMVSVVAFLAALYGVLFAKGEWEKRATILLCLSILIPYYIQFGKFPRLETRFILPIMPIWLLMTGPFWGQLRERKAILGLILIPLIGFNLLSSFYVGRRVLDDPRIRSEVWAAENIPSNSSIETDIYSPSWENIAGAEVTFMPFVSGRERLFEMLFPDNTFINGTEEDRRRNEEMIAWFSTEALMSRQPDYVAVNSLFYQRFLQPGIRRDLYPSMYDFFNSLLSDQSSYRIIFDQESKDVPSWVYPRDIDFIHNRMVILAASSSKNQ